MEPTLTFLEVTKTPEVFFQILPNDWQNDIAPYWANYIGTANIFVLMQNNQIQAGGIVFSTPSPDTMAYKELAETYFKRGYLYLAFIYVDEHQRGKNLGSIWLKNILKKYPTQKFWLTIEDEKLAAFYQKNGFQFSQKITMHNLNEWVFVID